MVAESVQPSPSSDQPSWLAPADANGQNGGAALSSVERQWFGASRELLQMPHLIEVQLRSFAWFRREGLRELFAEISPIADFTGKNLELELAVEVDLAVFSISENQKQHYLIKALK